MSKSVKSDLLKIIPNAKYKLTPHPIYNIYGINVDKDIADYEKFGVLKGLEFQKDLEKMAFEAGGKTQTAPGQRLTEFVEGRISKDLNATSYQPGLNSAPLHTLLPKLIGSRLRTGFKAFGQKMHGFYTNEANIIGVESRTSSYDVPSSLLSDLIDDRTSETPSSSARS